MNKIKLYGITVFSSICFLACTNLSKEQKKRNNESSNTVKTSVVGKWNITALKTKDTTLLPPGLTVYYFKTDGNYTMSLHKGESIISTYAGTYKYDESKKILATDYTIEDIKQHDEAQVIHSNINELHLVDLKTKDTILLKAYKNSTLK